MNDERAMQIVDEALELEPARRRQFVETACADDIALFQDVQQLLNCHSEARGLFDRGSLEIDTLPTRIGPYRLLEMIGEGGMGVVWRAEQREPIHRTVAIKVIKLGMDTREVVARFESERQALAMMNHPHVARVLDAGATDTGRPYFVMEHVPGEPITRFADRHRLTLRQRLELFIQACEAVQHAHQKAIIHRDLKPSNILVSLVDEKPVLKVIDFGVAKAISQRLTEKTLFTETGQLVGTPEYMSPEQAEMGSLDVDTRADVYSLGVVLYELITGTLPFDAATLRSGGYAEIQRIIREIDPPRPSTRLSTLGEQTAQIAQHRRTDPPSLIHELRRELEWIPLMAMRKDRTQRYATVADLAQDIRNYLHSRPLRAGPETTTYRVRKFLRRNRLAVTASAAVVLALLLGVTVSTVALVGQSRARAEAERQRTLADQRREQAEAVADFLRKDVLAGASPQRLPDRTVRDAIVRVMLDPAADRVGARFKDKPLLEASIRNLLAQVYIDLGRADLALPQAQAAVNRYRAALGDDHRETLGAVNDLATVMTRSGKLADAEPLLRQTLDAQRRVLGNDHEETLTTIANLGLTLFHQGKLAEAEPLWREALEKQRRVLGEGNPKTLLSMNSLASLLRAQGKSTESEALFRQSLRTARRALGDDHFDTILISSNLAELLQQQGKLAEAEALHRDAVSRCRRILGNDHPRTIFAVHNLASAVRGMGKHDEAEQLLRDNAGRARRVFGESHPDTLVMINNWATLLNAQQRYAEAEPLFDELYERTPHVRTDPARAALLMAGWGPCLVRLDRHADAETPLLQAYERLKKTNQISSATGRTVLSALVEVFERTGRPTEAERWRAELSAVTPATQPSRPSASR